MDFIFGTFASDELKIVHHRTARRGLQHDYALSPLDPLPGQPVTLSVSLGTDLGADHVACYYTLDGSAPQGARGVATRGHVLILERRDIVWDVVAWGYVARWQATLPPQTDGATVRYRIGAWCDGGMEVFADWPDVQDTAEAAAAAFFRDDALPPSVPGDPRRGQTFSYRVDLDQPPAWAHDAIIYHVFVDRFYPGHGRPWRQTSDLLGFAGGTLWGVRDQLDYIAALGATCLWLSPTWVSPSHHGYDVADYRQTEPRLGGDEALHAVVEAAHARGMRVLLDVVCNHLSNQHPVFQQAAGDPTSPYRGWFTFEASEVGYRAFFGTPTMPEINVEHPDARAWLLDVARYWLREFDVDGYRLDYANGPGPSFWTDFRTACREAKPDAFCVGEVVDQPAAMRQYVGRLDGCLDFHLGEALRNTFAYRTWSVDDLARFVERHETYLGPQAAFIRPTFIDNHDMDRFLFAARGDKDALRRVVEAQMRLPGPPVIYYGTEVGLSQRRSKADGFGLEVSREPMPWGDDQDRDLLTFYQSILRERRG